ncbi:MAG: Trm112 family protein [Terriglobia bacterium]
MAISKELLEILVCPVCKVSVQPTPDGKGLKCGQCRRVYPIKEDIPIMLVDEARIEPE